MTIIPQEVLDVLNKLDPSDQGIVKSYIHQLQQSQKEDGDGKDYEDAAMEEDDTRNENMEIPDANAEQMESDMNNNNNNDDDNMGTSSSAEPPFPPIYESGEDYDKAADCKQDAADLKSAGQYEAALNKYTEAVLVAPPSALLYANRAAVLLELHRPHAAIRDCDLALEQNPDSAKALRMRGRARKVLGQWELALHDLSASQAIDFDESCVEDLKFLTEKRIELEKVEAERRNQEEERLRKRAEEIKKAQAEAKKESQHKERSGGPSPGSAGMGGMPGGGGADAGGMAGIMGALLSDPELLQAMQNPKVQAAFQDLMGGPDGPMGLMSNPGKVEELMSDPEVGPVLMKLMAKLGPGVMGGGAAGMSPGANDADGIPNIDDMNDGVDLDDMPNLD